VSVEEMLVQPQDQDVVEVNEIFLEREPGVYKGKVVRILKGKVKDFIQIQRIRNPQVRDKFAKMADRTAYKIEVDVDGEIVEDVLIESRSPRSRFARVLSCYNGRIAKGMTVAVEFDGKYWRITCEEE